MIHFLIVGTGRCGTVYMAKLLTEMGIPCGHERIFGYEGLEEAHKVLAKGGDNSIVSRRSNLQSPGLTHHLTAESSFMAVPFMREPCLSKTKVIHVVRNPIKVIFSFVNGLEYFMWGKREKTKYEKFMTKYCPRIDETDDYCSRAIRYYLDWNKLVVTDGDYLFHRIEDDDERVIKFVGGSFKPQIDKDCNTWLSWPEAARNNSGWRTHATKEKLMESKYWDELIDFAASYGYYL